jgi:hypothetical protein
MHESKDPVLKILAHQRHYLNLLPNLTPRCQIAVYRHIRKLNRKLGDIYRESRLSENPEGREAIEPFQYSIDLDRVK